MAAEPSKVGDLGGTNGEDNSQESVSDEGGSIEGNNCSGTSTITHLDLRIQIPGSAEG